MAITPDTKDWTFVLRETCQECGFDVRTFPRGEVGQMIRQNASEWQTLLGHERVSERPSDDRWSGLEYGCHVKEVFALYAERLRMMLEQDDPSYPNWDQDAAAVEGRYSEQDPDEIAASLASNAEELAALFDSVEGGLWERTGRRSDGANFTVETFARYLIHDPVHHVHDVKEGYALLGAP